MASSGLLSLRTVKQLGKELLTSKLHINNVPALLSHFSKAVQSETSHSTSSSTSSSDESLLEALFFLRSFFLHRISSGELCLHSLEHVQQVASNKVHEDDRQPEAVYHAWLWGKYNEFVDLLLHTVTSPATSSSTRAASIDALMEFVRQEKPGGFSDRIYNRLCSTLVTSVHFTREMIEHLVANYFEYIDVCSHTCISLKKSIISAQGQKDQGEDKYKGDDSTREGANSQLLMSNIYDVLICINIPKTIGKSSENPVVETWVKLKDDGYQKKRNQGDVENANEKIKKLKSKITRVWLTFLQLPLTTMLYEKVLGHMHKAIIPNLTNPLVLSDFLTNSYNQGGLISVMALSGLFLLITEHGLEYPDYYNKLYALLEPSLFIAKYRSRFFELLDLSLKSPLLPSYLAAAFAKKLGRLSLKSPPAGALIVIAIVHNLLRRHPSINCLVHQNNSNAEFLLSNPLENGPKQEAEAMCNGNESPEMGNQEGLGKDPFIFSESNPANCNALKSSLWEIETLRRHYSPVVSRFVASLEEDLTVRAKTMELDIKDFSGGSYATIFAEEVKRRMKQVPLAFYKAMPMTLFSEHSDAPLQGFADFPGWSFHGKQSDDDSQHAKTGEHKSAHFVNEPSEHPKPDMSDESPREGKKKLIHVKASCNGNNKKQKTDPATLKGRRKRK
ncbi:hypothetical protein KP509_14G034900 [Ceratopteris richardii]|uniref:CCAAT-binding factor domain-containing protein n=1 Tax=Ceratopteris richardii TaxID=49495 RepID=A0A8T2T717_CERRI|nr:hypothetical protein KP509_14G034900 [Ceratopteris richardii]